MTTLGRDTTPEIGSCHRCLGIVLRCWVDGLHTTVDATPINLHGQLRALQTNQCLYQLYLRGLGRQHAELVPRDRLRIANRKPHIAFVEHQCGITWEAFRDPHAAAQFEQWRNPTAHRPNTTSAPPF